MAARSARWFELGNLSEMLSLRNVTVRFGGLVAVSGIDLDIPPQGVFALIGPNGAGKTTLINAVTRLCPISLGKITFSGQDLGSLKRHQLIELGIARSFQRAALFCGLTVIENVLVGLHSQIGGGLGGAIMSPKSRHAEREAWDRAECLLEQLDLWRYRDQVPSDLPHGYQKLLDVARALISEPKLLLLDEPFAGITKAEEPRLLECVIRAGESRAVLMIEHDFDLIASVASRVIVMNFGRKIAEATAVEVRRDPEVIACYLGSSALPSRSS